MNAQIEKAQATTEKATNWIGHHDVEIEIPTLTIPLPKNYNAVDGIHSVITPELVAPLANHLFSEILHAIPGLNDKLIESQRRKAITPTEISVKIHANEDCVITMATAIRGTYKKDSRPAIVQLAPDMALATLKEIGKDVFIAVTLDNKHFVRHGIRFMRSPDGESAEPLGIPPEIYADTPASAVMAEYNRMMSFLFAHEDHCVVDASNNFLHYTQVKAIAEKHAKNVKGSPLPLKKRATQKHEPKKETE